MDAGQMTGEVDVQVLPPICRVLLQKRRHGHAGRIGHQDFNPTKLLLDLRHHPIDLAAVGDIRHHGDSAGFPGYLLDLGMHRAPVNGNPGPLPGKPQGNCPADALPCACYQRNLVFKPWHAIHNYVSFL